MSDYYIKMIPTDPEFIPSKKQLDKLEELMPTLISWAADVSVYQYDDHPEFIDPGVNLGEVYCPQCKSQIDKEWWMDRVDVACNSNYLDLNVKVPCCGKSISLNDLDYEWPAGFAKFAIELAEPGLLEDEEIEWLEEELGMKLKLIKAHY